MNDTTELSNLCQRVSLLDTLSIGSGLPSERVQSITSQVFPSTIS